MVENSRLCPKTQGHLLTCGCTKVIFGDQQRNLGPLINTFTLDNFMCDLIYLLKYGIQYLCSLVPDMKQTKIQEEIRITVRICFCNSLHGP